MTSTQAPAPAPPPTTADNGEPKRAEQPATGGGIRDRISGYRDRVRAQPGLSHSYRVAVFIVGLVFIVGGFALAVLPGPLTIPPVLIGLWIWSTEFRFAHRLFEAFKEKAREAWAHAQRHPVSSVLITVGGLAAAGAVIWAVQHFALVSKAKEAIGF